MSARRHPNTGSLVAVAAGLLALAGCGVPIDREPRPISQTTVAVAAPVPTTVAPTGAPMVEVYFLNVDRLQAEEYPVEGEATLGKALDFVLAAPPDDASDDLHTSVPPGTQLRGVEVTDGLATIDLTGEINDIGGPAQKEAFAQIVFTALGFEEVQRVRFFIDGEPIDAPTDDGNLAEIDADNYDPPLNPR
ncbi:GerMN domain-containing protein [Aquihabitans daechungensis]|uniref:GerMN domain-containing protein n=1 Tax=Aquihabitans daechungensis TaxID=1052257 RepID=UPI003BA01677